MCVIKFHLTQKQLHTTKIVFCQHRSSYDALKNSFAVLNTCERKIDSTLCFH